MRRLALAKQGLLDWGSGLHRNSCEGEAHGRPVAPFAFGLGFYRCSFCSFAGVKRQSLLDRQHAGSAPEGAPSVQVVMVLAVAALYHKGRHVASSIVRVMLKANL